MCGVRGSLDRMGLVFLAMRGDGYDWGIRRGRYFLRASESKSSFVIFWSMNSEREGPGGRRGLMLVERVASERRNIQFCILLKSNFFQDRNSLFTRLL
jgi:hypothetical protein